MGTSTDQIREELTRRRNDADHTVRVLRTRAHQNVKRLLPLAVGVGGAVRKRGGIAGSDARDQESAAAADRRVDSSGPALGRISRTRRALGLPGDRQATGGAGPLEVRSQNGHPTGPGGWNRRRRGRGAQSHLGDIAAASSQLQHTAVQGPDIVRR